MIWNFYKQSKISDSHCHNLLHLIKSLEQCAVLILKFNFSDFKDFTLVEFSNRINDEQCKSLLFRRQIILYQNKANQMINRKK